MLNFVTTFVYQVVRLCAKSREAVSSPVEHLTLHYQVGFCSYQRVSGCDLVFIYMHFF